MSDVWGKIDRDKLAENVREQLGRDTVGKPLRAVAASFQTLRELRELADYEPIGSFTIEDAQNAISQAEYAMGKLDEADPTELTDVLALMLAGTRR